MKTHSLLLIIFIILVTSCAPQSGVTPSPTQVITNTPIVTDTPIATTTPQPTQTLAPTATTISVAETSLDSCTQIIEAKVSSAGVLEIVYKSTDASPRLWLWSEDTQTAVPFPLPPDALDPILSTDHHRIIFQRNSGETQSELWVIGVDGKAEKKLVTVRLDDKEIKLRYPDGYFWLEYGWVPNTDTFFYAVHEGVPEQGPTIIHKVVLVDTNSGRIISLAIPPEIITFKFAPDGSQIAVLTESESRVLSTQDGQEQYTIRDLPNIFEYSPDGKYIIGFINEGILRIDARDGQEQIIPLKYTIMNSPYRPLPPNFRWVGNSMLLLASLDSNERYVSFVEPDPNWTFTVWQVDLASGTTHPIQTFSGDPSSVRFSPDNKRLAFQKYQGVASSQKRDLLLADLATGKILETVEGGLFEAWSPDSNRYLYMTGLSLSPPGKNDPGTSEVDIKYYLSQAGKEPILLNWSVSSFGWPSGSWWGVDRWWVDKNILVRHCKIMVLP